MTALIAFILLIGMFILGARVHGVRHSFWKFLAFVTACLVVLALVLAFLSR
jgi:hypothetical protein